MEHGTRMKQVYAIILAGGRGARLGADTPKQFLDLNGIPVIAWSLQAFSAIKEINGIVVVTPDDCHTQMNAILSEYGSGASRLVVTGGETRQQSSYNALRCMAFDDEDILLFHDAARPFITRETILRCIAETELHGAAAVYVHAVDTVTEGDNGFVTAIPPREKLYYAQTPQCFRYRIIRDAHETALSRGITASTDDVALVKNAGYAIKIVEGDGINMKITTSFDYELAGYIAERHFINRSR